MESCGGIDSLSTRVGEARLSLIFMVRVRGGKWGTGCVGAPGVLLRSSPSFLSTEDGSGCPMESYTGPGSIPTRVLRAILSSGGGVGGSDNYFQGSLGSHWRPQPRGTSHRIRHKNSGYVQGTYGALLYYSDTHAGGTVPSRLRPGWGSRYAFHGLVQMSYRSNRFSAGASRCHHL